MKIKIVSDVTDELVEAIQYLIPQLTGTAEDVTKSSIEEVVNSESTFLFVAEKDAKVIGALTLVIFRIPTGKKAFIEDVVVDDNAQGLGLGRKLLETAIEYAKNESVKKIELSSNPSRIAANALYKKIGFEVRETNFYRMDL